MSGRMCVRLCFRSAMIRCGRVLPNIPGVNLVALDVFNTKDALSARKILFVDSVRTIAYLKSRGETMRRSVRELDGPQHT